ncbi:MAG: transposase [Sulfurimonas sp.]
MPNYKRVFLDGYSYFLTVVTHQRNPILIDNIELLRESFRVSKSKYNYKIDAIVIMPDHFHMIVTPEISMEYPDITKTIKQHFSKYCDEKYFQHLYQSNSRHAKGYKPIWQKRFYEHTIRDEKDYKIRLDYIHYNPVKHRLAGKVSDWEYSSFHKFVEKGYYDNDWGAFDESIDFE